MSSIIPKRLIGKIKNYLSSRLSFGSQDFLSNSWIQTRLIFSKTIFLIVAALFVGFSIATISQKIHSQRQAFEILLFQISLLSIIMNLNHWGAERDNKTYEILVMKIPNTHSLIWMKLRVSLFWVCFLIFPFLIGFTWFVEIPILRSGFFYILLIMLSLVVSLITCVVSTIVRQELIAGIISLLLFFALAGLFEGLQGTKFAYSSFIYNPYQIRGFFYAFSTDPFSKKLIFFFINRLFYLLTISGLYWWLYRRLSETEKWVS